MQEKVSLLECCSSRSAWVAVVVVGVCGSPAPEAAEEAVAAAEGLVAASGTVETCLLHIVSSCAAIGGGGGGGR